MPEVKNVKEAIEIAKEVIKSAGYPIHFITKTEKDKYSTKWVVEVFAPLFGGKPEKFIIEIDISTGEVLDFKPTE
jgi:hypothetical protein